MKMIRKLKQRNPKNQNLHALTEKIAAVDTTKEEGEIKTPHQVIDMDDVDDEVAKLTQTIPPPDIDWKKLPRHNTNSPHLYGSSVRWKEPMPEMIKKLQNSSWFVTPLSECDDKQKSKRDSFKKIKLYKELIK
jgi:hypothetical protein